MRFAKSILERLTSTPSRRQFAKGWDRLTDTALGVLKLLPLVLLAAFLYQYFHEGIVMKPFSVTKTLSEEGVTDVVVAEELRQRIYAIYERASLDDRAASGIELAPELPDITVLATRVSIDTIFDAFAAVLPWKTRTVISGAFTNESGRLRLAVLVDGKQVYRQSIVATSATHDSLLDGAADAVVETTRPLSHAFDLLRKRQSSDAYRFLTVMINRSAIESKDIARAYQLRGFILLDEHKLTDACDQFAKALRIDPNSGETYQNLSALFSKEGERQLATAEAEKAVIFTRGRDSWSYYALGNRYYDQEKWAEAENAYRRVIHLWFEDPFAHDALGQVLRNEQKLEESLIEFDVAIALNGSFAKALDDRGELLLQEDKLPDAKLAFMEASNADSTFGKPHDGLGMIYFRKQRYELAAAEFISALHLDHDDIYAYPALKQSLLQEAMVTKDWRARKAIAVSLDDADVCHEPDAVKTRRLSSQMLREVARTRCSSARAGAVTGNVRARKCLADPVDISPFQAASKMRMLPAITLLCWFAVVEWTSEHMRGIAVVLVGMGFVLFGWCLRAPGRGP